MILVLLFAACTGFFLSGLETVPDMASMDEEAPFSEAILNPDIDSAPELMKLLAEEMGRPEVQKYLDGIVQMMGFIVCGLMMFALPGVTVVYLLVFFCSRPRYART